MISSLFSVNGIAYLLVLLAFVLGSVPFGILFTRKSGIDIRSMGSRNIGATNVLRFAGKKPALLTLLCDLLKGVLPVLICKILIERGIVLSESQGMFHIVADFWIGVVGLSAVLGHMYSVFLAFNGGKGVATGFGVLLIYSPVAAGIALLIWILVAFAFRYSSLAAIIAATAVPLLLILFQASVVKIAITLILAALIVYKHISNITNLLNGKETKIGSRDRA